MYILDFQTDKSSFIMYFWLRQLQCHMANVGVYNNPISLGGSPPPRHGILYTSSASQNWQSAGIRQISTIPPPIKHDILCYKCIIL